MLPAKLRERSQSAGGVLVAPSLAERLRLEAGLRGAGAASAAVENHPLDAADPDQRWIPDSLQATEMIIREQRVVDLKQAGLTLIRLHRIAFEPGCLGHALCLGEQQCPRRLAGARPDSQAGTKPMAHPLALLA